MCTRTVDGRVEGGDVLDRDLDQTRGDPAPGHPLGMTSPLTLGKVDVPAAAFWTGGRLGGGTSCFPNGREGKGVGRRDACSFFRQDSR